MMNERIRELAERAVELCQTEYESESLRQRQLYNEIFLPKFAELIVEECMNIALDKKKWVENQVVFDPRDQAWNKARVQQSQHIVDKIKEHFGVEE